MDEIKSIPRTQERLAKLKEWLANSEYQAYLAACRQDIINCQENIIRTPPIDDVSRARCLMHHGRLDLLNDNLQVFETARTELEHQLSILLDEATQIAPTTTEPD